MVDLTDWRQWYKWHIFCIFPEDELLPRQKHFNYFNYYQTHYNAPGVCAFYMTCLTKSVWFIGHYEFSYNYRALIYIQHWPKTTNTLQSAGDSKLLRDTLTEQLIKPASPSRYSNMIHQNRLFESIWFSPNTWKISDFEYNLRHFSPSIRKSSLPQTPSEVTCGATFTSGHRGWRRGERETGGSKGWLTLAILPGSQTFCWGCFVKQSSAQNKLINPLLSLRKSIIVS